jgi:RecA-family ATPase
MNKHFDPIKYVVPGYVAEGLTILAGRPKLGKSWMALDMAVAVATGGKALGSVQCDHADVLYLALEDNDRRLKDRLSVLMPGFKSQRPDLSRLHTVTRAPKLGQGLIEAIDECRKKADDLRLLIVDTHAMVRPPKRGNQDQYSADYESISPLQQFAGEHRLACIVVTHVRKAEAEDPLEQVSGTNGLTGAADSTLILDRDSSGAKLYGRGRDVEEIEKALRFDAGRWSVLGDADEIQRSAERRKIIDAVKDAGVAISPDDIAKSTGMKVSNVSRLLGKMVTASEIEKIGYGTYKAAA